MMNGRPTTNSLATSSMPDDEGELPRHIGEIANGNRYQRRIVGVSNTPPVSPPELPAEVWAIDEFKMQRMWSTVYHGLTPRFELKGIEILLVAIILSLSLKNKWCWASEKTLARLCGVSIPTIEKYLKSLSMLGRGVIMEGGKTAKGTIKRKLSLEAEDHLNFLRPKTNTKK